MKTELWMDIRRGRVSFLAWPFVLACVLSLYSSVYGSMFNTIQAKADMMKNLPPAMKDLFPQDMITSGSGFITTVFFILIGFILFSIACTSWAVSLGARVLDSGESELIFSHSLSRSQYFRAHMLASFLRAFLCALAVVGILALFTHTSNLALSADGTFLAILAWLGHGFLVFSTAGLVGIITGKKSNAYVAGACVAAFSYIMDAVGKLVDSASWMLHFSPLYWTFGNDLLGKGFSLGFDVYAKVGGVWLLGLCVLVCARMIFMRKDLC